MNRSVIYLAANLLFAAVVMVGFLTRSNTGVHPLYLLPLFALCSAPILHITRLNGRYALLGLFFTIYFLFYGVLDFFNVISGAPVTTGSGTSLSASELVILAGGALAYAGYQIACRAAATTTDVRAARDWPESALVLAGAVLWLGSTWLSWKLKIYVLVDTSTFNQGQALASAGALKASVFMLATYLQPLSILILAYTQAKYRRAYMLPVLIVVVLVQLVIGFVEDVKGDALIGFVIVFLTKMLVAGRIPRQWLAGGLIFIVLAWPVLQANRAVRGEHSLNHAEAAGNIFKTLALATEAKTRVTKGPDRADTIFERLSLKGSVEMIVSGTAHGVKFQDGHTLSPVLATFIPRLIWHNKPDVQTGLVMNKAFQVNGDDDTYISPSHLGELYWNFGWPGVVVGMSFLGLMLGYLGTKLDLSESVTLTRVMIIVVTIRLIILGFEGAIASQYVVWLRSMLAVGLLHVFLARTSVAEKAEQSTAEPARAAPAQNGSYFPNLMR